MDKIIHYCWFGGNPLPELAQKCIASWKKHCPDYEIRQWNESNFDLDCCDYVREAVQYKKWAFASDYARFKILYEHGGLYFDTDVELIKPIDDIVASGPFMGFEKHPGEAMVNPGLVMGAVPGQPFYKEVLEDYEKSHFVENGAVCYYSVVERITKLLKNYGLRCEDSLQTVSGITIYPSEYFCPLSFDSNVMVKTEQTRSIHWYDASWLDARMKKRQAVNAAIRRALPGSVGEVTSKVYTKLSYLWEWTVTGKLVQKIGKKLRNGKK